jgi:hypothetical protein
LRDELLNQCVGRGGDLRPGGVRGQVGDRGAHAAFELREKRARVVVDLAVRLDFKPEAAEEIFFSGHIIPAPSR